MSFFRIEGNGPLNFAGFNQDAACFAVGTDTGFRIYNCDPFKETFIRPFSSTEGGIGFVEMLFRCNILALVGGGRHPRFALNKVILWDDHQGRCIGELTYRPNILAVKLRRDRVVVVTSEQIFVYNFSDLKLIDNIKTIPNPCGLISVCAASDNNIIACPGTQIGSVLVSDYNGSKKKKQVLIQAHETALQCIALSIDGHLLATASEKGTLVRVWSTSTGNLLHELRRGAERAEIFSIAFHRNNQWLVVSSDKGTVHIFSLASQENNNNNGNNTNNNNKQNVKANTTSSLSFFSSILPKYFSSQWSHAQFKTKDCRNIVSFGKDEDSIIVVCADGTFFKARFDLLVAGQECVQESYAEFIRPETQE